MKRILLLITLSVLAFNINAQCSIDGISVNPTISCPSTTYEVSGAVVFTNAPVIGTLDIVIDDGVSTYSTSISLPVASPVNYTILNIPANGNSTTLTASFSLDPTCSANPVNYTAPICPCVFDALNLNVGTCQSATNTYIASGTLEFNSAPSTGTLIVSVDDGISSYDTIISPPFTSPQTYSISGIPSNGNSSTLTAYFSSSPSCSTNINYTAPGTCSCIADVGTFVTSTQTTSISPNILVYGDTFTLTSNQDYTFAQELLNGGGISYEPGISYLIYTCPPSTADPAADPCILGVVGSGNSISSLNSGTTIFSIPFTAGDVFYYTPITMYNLSQNIYSNAIESCFELGTPISVLYLGPINTTTIISNPNTGEVNFDINGALPDVDASNFTISNIQPTNASVNSTSITNNGNLVISGLNPGDIWSVNITDDAGSIIVITNEYLNLNVENSLQIEVFPNPASNEININGITEPTNIEIYSISGAKLIQSELTTNGQINISELPKGTYTIVATSSTGTVTKMIVK